MWQQLHQLTASLPLTCWDTLAKHHLVPHPEQSMFEVPVSTGSSPCFKMACRTHEEIPEKISRSIASCVPLVYPESVPCLPNMPTYEEMSVSLIPPITTILQFSFSGEGGRPAYRSWP